MIQLDYTRGRTETLFSSLLFKYNIKSLLVSIIAHVVFGSLAAFLFSSLLLLVEQKQKNLKRDDAKENKSDIEKKLLSYVKARLKR